MPNKVTNKKNIEIFKQDINSLSYEESISALETILNKVQDEREENVLRDVWGRGSWGEVRPMSCPAFISARPRHAMALYF